MTENATEHNPSVPTGLVNFEYVISSVTVTNSTRPVIKFLIKKDGTAVVFSASTATTTLLDGFTGGPSFLVSYADGTKSKIDFNNLGKAAAQPASVTILNLKNGTGGTMTGPDSSGYYTATITTAANGFPAGSKLRTIALQAYFTQAAGTGGIAAATARHTVSVVKEVSGETRRSVVDPVKCSNCHEIFEGHGGNRNISKDTTGTIICLLCHNPNLSSSGRQASVANMNQANNQANKDALTADGYNPNDPLSYPEASNNFKDMIHGIHASGARTTPYQFVRDRGASGVFYYNWSEVTFPGILNNCETCHKPGTYDAELPAGVMLTTDKIGGAAATTAGVSALRATVDNASDNVTTPVTSTCVACHTSSVAKSHMTQNGGQISVLRSSATSEELCAICHGIGRSADVVEVHK
jgi:OmcA/MtrC family decaheme c-type cytochrome